MGKTKKNHNISLFGKFTLLQNQGQTQVWLVWPVPTTLSRDPFLPLPSEKNVFDTYDYIMDMH